MRALLFFPLLLAASPAMAETVHCADQAGEVAVEFDLDRSGETTAVTRVQMQIDGDFGISTDPGHEDYSGEDLAETTIGAHFIEIVLRVDGGLPALTLRLVDADHGDTWLRAGVLSVAGGGVWVVSCDTPV